ncbi:MAG: type 1 glutamine amidotransferase domain-containing protein [Candidatus Eisenbacteria bacterium]
MSDRLLTPSPSLPNRAGRALLRGLGLHPEDRRAPSLNLSGRSALCVATNHGVLDIGVPTGVFGSELTIPYYRFADAGMRVDVASPKGGIVPIDPLSLKEALRTPEDDRMLGDDVLRGKLTRSLAISEIEFASYDLVYFAGGWGAAFDLGQSEELGEQVSAAYAARRVLGGICHGPLGLLRARDIEGRPLVEGRRLTAVTDRQIRQLGVSITPLHPESALRAAGANFECAHHPIRDFFANHYVVDGDLVTGQNQNAGPVVARRMMELVLAKPATKRPIVSIPSATVAARN